jgi:spermidine synthase
LTPDRHRANVPAVAPVLYALFFVSGAAALVYQVAWQRSISLVFGGSQLAIATVLAVFMGGLALGGALIGRRADASARPLRLYGLLEVGIAVSALAFIGLMRVFPSVYVPLARLAEHNRTYLTAVRIVLAGTALLVPTTMMGGTLPVLSRFVSRRTGSFASRLSFLYAFNTLGAMTGAFAAGFFLLRAVGVTAAALVAVAANLAIGLAAILLPERLFEDAPPKRSKRKPDADPAPSLTGDAPPLVFPLVLWAIGGSGFCALGYEVLWTRTLSLVVGTSVYGFTIMLVAFLGGLALGSQIYGFVQRRVRASVSGSVLGFGAVQVGIGASALAVTILMRDLPATALQLQAAFAGGAATEFHVRLAASAIVAIGYMLVPATLMGAAFPLAGAIHAAWRRQIGRAVGDVQMSNTVGAIAGALVSGFLLVDTFGLERSLQLLAATNVGIGLVVAAALARRRLAVWGAAAATAALLLVLAIDTRWGRAWDMKRWALFRNNGRERLLDPEVVARYVETTDVLYHFEGVNETINVVRSHGGFQAFGVNGRTEASTHPGDMQCQYTLGHLPMLLHQNPRRVFVLGAGAGMTLGATSAHPEVERIALAEIEPGVLPATRTFGAWNHDVLDNPKLSIVFNDGRNFLATTRETFDVITADPIHPWSGGASYLYTREYFRTVSRRLAPGGIVAQWLPIYELAPRDVKTVLRTFADVFPHVVVWLTYWDAEIVASNDPIIIDEAAVARRIAGNPAVKADLERVEMESAERFLSYFVFGREGARRYAQGGSVNTDDNLFLEFSSPESIGVSELMGTNVAEITSLRESIVHHLKLAPTESARAADAARWARSDQTNRLVDRMHVLSLLEQRDTPEFLAVRDAVAASDPDHGRFDFLRRLDDRKREQRPAVADVYACEVMTPAGTPRRMQISAVVVRVGDTRWALYVVDNDRRSLFRTTYVDGPPATLHTRLKAVTAAHMDAVRKACADATEEARHRGGSVGEAALSGRIRTALASAQR